MVKNQNQHRAIHVLSSLDYGGVERHMEILAEYQSHSLYTHEFIAITSEGAAARVIRGFGCYVLCFGVASNIPNISLIAQLRNHLLKRRPCVVHTHGAEANFHGVLAARLAGVRIVIAEEIGIPEHSLIARLVFALIYRLAYRVIAVSSVVESWLIDSREVGKGKVVTINNPGKLPAQLRPEPKGDQFIVGFVGRLEPVKNPISLLTAFNEFKLKSKARSELWFIGDGSLRQSLQSEILRLSLGDCVKQFGFLERPLDELAKCDVFVQPSRTEGFSLALIEAIGLGVPVISTKTGAASELIGHNYSGFLISDGSQREICAALIKVHSLSGQQRRQIAVAARENLEAIVSPSIYFSRLDSLYSLRQ